MALELPALPYAYDALGPYMSKETLEYHHDKHHMAYVTNGNAALKDSPLADKSIEEICKVAFADKIAPSRKFRLPTDQERAAMADLRARLAAWEGGQDGDALQSMVFAVGKDHGFEPLRDWFKARYEVLLGASEGPRFGGFVALYGVTETIALIDKGLAGELVG